MSQEQLLITLASGGAVLALIVIAWALGFRQRAPLADAADVARAVTEYEPAAQVADAFLDKTGAAALARLTDGRFAVVRRMADKLAVRIFRPGAAKLKPTRQGLRVTFADLGFPRVDVRYDGAPPAWVSAQLEGKT